MGLDASLRWHDVKHCHPSGSWGPESIVTPAEAGVQKALSPQRKLGSSLIHSDWMPAYAGMTGVDMFVRIQKWGNSQEICISKDLLEKVHLQVGDGLVIQEPGLY